MHMQSREVNILKATLPILVVLIHCNFLPNVDGRQESIQGFVMFIRIFSYCVLSLAVPAFFFLSGYLFFLNGGNLSRKDYIHKMKRRTKTLLLPYLIWNVLGLLLLAVKMHPSLHQHFPLYTESDLTAKGILMGFWSLSHSPYPYDMPLWFIRNLIVVQCFAYPIGLMLRGLKVYAVVPAVAAVALVEILWPDANAYGLVHSFFFFTFGGYASLSMKGTFLPVRNLTLWTIGYLAIAGLYVIAGGTLLYYVKTSAGILLLGKLAARQPADGFRLPPLLEKSSFFVYAFHGLFITVTQKLTMTLCAPNSDLTAASDYIMTFIILYGVSLTAYMVLERFLPSLTHILCGGR